MGSISLKGESSPVVAAAHLAMFDGEGLMFQAVPKMDLSTACVYVHHRQCPVNVAFVRAWLQPCRGRVERNGFSRC
jgi:hypothetical protein